MKNITHYFVENVKSCENSSTESKIEDKSKDEVTRKRARVKIKISRTNSKNRVCNIVENKNDVVDKTPSPFTKASKEAEEVNDGTPKKAAINKCETLEIVDLTEISVNTCKSTKQTMNAKISFEPSIEKKSNCNIENDSKFKTENNMKKINIEASSDTFDVTKEQEESNAFQILMNQGKPIEYALTMQSLYQNTVLNKKIDNESKEKLKYYKERLIAFADTKGYSKRKLAEMEEEERIERTIAKRMKFFKGNTINDNNFSIGNNDQNEPSNNLLNHPSKTPMEEHQDISNMSTLVVKADVHVSEESTEGSLDNKIKSKLQIKSRAVNRTSCTKVSHTDDVDIITEDIEHQPTNKNGLKILQQQDKSRWSVRIKLKSSTDEKTESLLGANGVKEDTIFSPKSKTKLHELSKKRGKMSTNSTLDNNGIEGKSKQNKIGTKPNKSIKTNLQKKEKNNQEQKSKINITENSINDTSIKAKNITKFNDEIEILKESKNKKFDESVGVISESAVPNILNDKSKKKLAPLFLKQRKSDSAAQEARRLFLQPDTMGYGSKNIRKKIVNCAPAILPFPTVSHITQLNSTSKLTETNNYNIPMKPEVKYIPTINCKTYTWMVNPVKSLTKQLVTTKKCSTEDINKFLTEIEKTCKDATKIWTTILPIAQRRYNATSSVKPKGGRRKSLVKTAIAQETKDTQIQNSMWTQKYKPLNMQKIIGNEEATSKLRHWLNGWQASLTVQEDSINSADEFYSSDCSYVSKIENNQVAVLLGPHGSGKTASVYAVAEELGYSVLEVNASSKRTGKRILKEFEEATKSHRIEKEKVNSLSTTVLKKSNKVTKNSLILLEDVDLIFDEDEGFVSAACQLAINTKRPIVMTCRDICSHLSKMAPDQNRIYFQQVDSNKLSTLLELIAMAETGSRLSEECLAELLLSGDLRKALLQLQYLLVSGFPQKCQPTLKLTSIPWQDMKHCLYKPAIKITKKQKAKQTSCGKTTNSNSVTIKVLNNLASNLDRISLLPSLTEIKDPALNVTHIKAQPSLSLKENMTLYCASQHLSTEIAEWINEKVLSKRHLTGKDRLQYQANVMLKRQLNEGVNFALAQVAPSVLDSRTMCLDYLPYVRTICRAEENRIAKNPKRGNRFFHYLHGLKLPISSTKPNILAAACKMLQEKMEKPKEDLNTY